MPRLSAWFIRASLIYLLIGFTFGALILAQKGIPYHPAVWNLFPTHIEFLLLGWLVQLAMGVAFWILPRFGRQRGNEKLIWGAFISLNLGISLTAFQPWLSYALLAGRILEFAGILLFIIGSWPRVKPAGAK
jgi:hypothetical protein